MTTAHSTTEKEMTAIAEEELGRLQRQLRIMEDDRMAYADETKKTLEKQRKVIKILKKEKAKIEENLKVATSKTHTKRDEEYTKKVGQQLKDYDKYCQAVEKYKHELKEVNVQTKKVETGIKKIRAKNLVTDQEYQFRIKSGQKSIKTLENRLENSVKKFCKILVENKALREEIDHLLKERSNFNTIWEKHLQGIQNGKRLMMELIDQGTMAYDQREEWGSKLGALKKRTQSDIIEHIEEMRDIERKLEHDSRLKSFLCVKGQKRILKDLEEKERLKQEEQDENLENQLKIYEETLTKIQSFGKETDVERIASQFLKQEEENFALFNYVNELNHEIESFNATVSNLHDEIEEQKLIIKDRAKERSITLSSLKEDLNVAVTDAKEKEFALKMAKQQLQTILDGILDMFTILKCEKGPILKLVGEDINFYNAMTYMGCVEKKISDMITQLFYITKSGRNGKGEN